MSKKEKPVKVVVLKAIYSAVLPAHDKLNCLVDDVVSGNYTLSPTEKSVLFDSASCCIALKAIFEDLLEEAAEANVEVLYLPEKEFVSILSMSKAVEFAERTSFGTTGIWSH